MQFSLAVLALLQLASARVSPFCREVDSAVSAHHEEQQATSFCSSYLSISTATITSTVTRTSTATATSVASTTSTSTATPVTVITGTNTATTIVTATASTTSTSTHTLTSALTGCPSPEALTLRKREAQRTTPGCFSSWSGPWVSSACSCLHIPHPTKTSTATSVVTTTVTTVTTKTIVVATTPTTSVAASTITTQTTTTTDTVTITTTATYYNDFALYATYNDMYGTVAPASGSSASGIKFDTDEITAAHRFGYYQGDLYSGAQSIRAYQETSGNYYFVTNPGFGVFGYNTGCDLDMTPDATGGCLVTCRVGGSGLFPSASGNNHANYGVWGVSGSTDQFLVYAVSG